MLVYSHDGILSSMWKIVSYYMQNVKGSIKDGERNLTESSYLATMWFHSYDVFFLSFILKYNWKQKGIYKHIYIISKPWTLKCSITASSEHKVRSQSSFIDCKTIFFIAGNANSFHYTKQGVSPVIEGHMMFKDSKTNLWWSISGNR